MRRTYMPCNPDEKRQVNYSFVFSVLYFFVKKMQCTCTSIQLLITEAYVLPNDFQVSRIQLQRTEPIGSPCFDFSPQAAALRHAPYASSRDGLSGFQLQTLTFKLVPARFNELVALNNIAHHHSSTTIISALSCTQSSPSETFPDMPTSCMPIEI